MDYARDQRQYRASVALQPDPNPFGCQITKTMVRTKIAPASNINPPDRTALPPCIYKKLNNQLSEFLDASGLCSHYRY
jgi:hypothetical protein